MTLDHIFAVYFSPTGGTRNAVTLLAGYFCDFLGAGAFEEIDFTSPAAREKEYHFGERDFVVIGSPVYAGRVPNKIMPDWGRCFFGGGAVAVPVVVYGNRSFDSALTEFRVILKEAGFRIAAGAALVGRHAFTDAVGAGRPDEEDLSEYRIFAATVSGILSASPEADVPFLRPADAEDVLPYYTPLKEDGTPAKFLKAKPKTDPETCDLCGICRESCPMGSIDDKMEAVGVCIKCQACVRKCPRRAKYFTDADFLSHVRMLERDCRGRAENRFLLPDIGLYASQDL